MVARAISLYLLHELAELQSYKYKKSYKWWHTKQSTRWKKKVAHLSLQILMAFGHGSPHILHHQLDTMCMDFCCCFQVGLQPVRDRGDIYYTWKPRAPPLLEF